MQVKSQEQIQSQMNSKLENNMKNEGKGGNKEKEGGVREGGVREGAGEVGDIAVNSNLNKNMSSGSNLRFNTGLLLSPMDNYSKYLLEQINKIRIDPQSFIGVIEDAKVNITKSRKGGYIYNGKIKIALHEGESAFDEAIQFLNDTESMGKLEFCPQLTPELPKNLEEIKDRDDLKFKVENMINNGIKVKSYWRDIIRDPEISFLLMIVDDNGSRKGMKRKDILNPFNKYIGISSVEINNNFVCYITCHHNLQK